MDSFAGNQLFIALDVSMEGGKIILGMIESSTENQKVCKEILLAHKDRGLNDEHKLLFFIDRAKGLRKGFKNPSVTTLKYNVVSSTREEMWWFIYQNHSKTGFEKNYKKSISKTAIKVLNEASNSP